MRQLFDVCACDEISRARYTQLRNAFPTILNGNCCDYNRLVERLYLFPTIFSLTK